jgi:hypothetical protein
MQRKKIRQDDTVKHLMMQIINRLAPGSSDTNANPETRKTRHFATCATCILTWRRESPVLEEKDESDFLASFGASPSH